MLTVVATWVGKDWSTIKVPLHPADPGAILEEVAARINDDREDIVHSCVVCS